MAATTERKPMQALPAPQTRMIVTKTFMASAHVPSSLLETYETQRLAVEVTVALIADLIRETPEYKGLTKAEIPTRAVNVNPLAFNVRHTAMVDGNFKEIGTTSSPMPGKGFIEASTLNLLLSSKIITDAEKRAVLKSRDLLPEVEDDAKKTDAE
jgi:hypothetical protein